jgi:hypothetical protein
MIYANKGNRDEFDGKAVLRAMRDTFYPDGRRRAVFTIPWWKAGRWIEIAVRTGTEPLVLHRLAIAESRYPLEVTATFGCDDPTIAPILKLFWNEKRGMVADTVAKDRFSEHAQCLALLAGMLSPHMAKRAFAGLVEADDLARCTIYFSHYLFETYLRFGRADLFQEKLSLWRDLVRDGLRTPVEAPGERGRSDCHAWGAHPLYHFQTGIAGIRPVCNGFTAAEIAPQFGPLTRIKASMLTPKGLIAIDLHRDGDSLSGTIAIPPNLPATFIWRGNRIPLRAGNNNLH